MIPFENILGSFSMVLKQFELGPIRSSKKLKSGRKVMMDMWTQKSNRLFLVQKLKSVQYYVLTP